jgi:SAM-dependent methyltransferase
MTATTFDPGAYKETTRQQWQEAAEAWHRWGPTLEEWLGEATGLMLDLAHVREGDRVLDIAAGAGGQTLAAARRVGPGGAVLATDISSNILELAAQEARRNGHANVGTHTVDGETLDVEPESFDAAICRLGFMYLPDLHSCLEGARRALKPGGRAAGIVFAPPDTNGFFSLPVSIVRRVAGLGAPAAGQPGPFSLGAPGALEQAFAAAGYVGVEVSRVAAPLRMPSAAECTRFERESFGALHQMLSGVSPDEREAAWAEIERELGRFEGPDGFVGPCELLVAAGTAP